MTKKQISGTSSSKRKSSKTPSPVFPSRNRRKELRFDHPLPAVVKGNLPSGKKFKENTIIQNISSGGAYFGLDADIIIGSELEVFVEVPVPKEKGKKIKLSLFGSTVRLEASTEEEKKLYVALQFNKQYRFIDEENSN